VFVDGVPVPLGAPALVALLRVGNNTIVVRVEIDGGGTTLYSVVVPRWHEPCVPARWDLGLLVARARRSGFASARERM
jgi:hypothetical protein